MSILYHLLFEIQELRLFCAWKWEAISQFTFTKVMCFYVDETRAVHMFILYIHIFPCIYVYNISPPPSLITKKTATADNIRRRLIWIMFDVSQREGWSPQAVGGHGVALHCPFPQPKSQGHAKPWLRDTWGEISHMWQRLTGHVPDDGFAGWWKFIIWSSAHRETKKFCIEMLHAARTEKGGLYFWGTRL